MNVIKTDPHLQESLDLSRDIWSAMTDSTLDSSEITSVIQEILENASFTCASGLSPGSPSFGETVEIARHEPPSSETLEEESEIELSEEESIESEISPSDGDPVGDEDLADLTFCSYGFNEDRLLPLASFRKTLEKARTEDSFNPKALRLLEMIDFEIELAKLGTSIKPFDFLIRALTDNDVTEEELADLKSVLDRFRQTRLHSAEF